VFSMGCVPLGVGGQIRGWKGGQNGVALWGSYVWKKKKEVSRKTSLVERHCNKGNKRKKKKKKNVNFRGLHSRKKMPGAKREGAKN